MRDPVTCCARCLRCRSSCTMMKPTVAKRNMPAAIRPRPPFVLPIVATSTIDPRLPSIGIAFMSTPLAPSLGSICGGGWSTSCPVGISGASIRVPRSVVVNAFPLQSRPGGLRSRGNYPAGARLTPPVAGEGGRRDDERDRRPGAERARPGRCSRPGRALRCRGCRRRRGLRPPGRARDRPDPVHARRRDAAAGPPALAGRGPGGRRTGRDHRGRPGRRSRATDRRRDRRPATPAPPRPSSASSPPPVR